MFGFTEERLDLFAFGSGNPIIHRLHQRSRMVTSRFIWVARNPARYRVRTASLFQGACLAVGLESEIPVGVIRKECPGRP